MKWIESEKEHPPLNKLLLGLWIEGDQKEIYVFYYTMLRWCVCCSGKSRAYARPMKNGEQTYQLHPPFKWSEFEVPEEYDVELNKECEYVL